MSVENRMQGLGRHSARFRGVVDAPARYLDYTSHKALHDPCTRKPQTLILQGTRGCWGPAGPALVVPELDAVKKCAFRNQDLRWWIW